LALVASAAACALAASACAAQKEGSAGAEFKPVKPGVLTVATAFIPAPGFWQGTPPTDGFEARLALALAHHLGLERVEVVQVPFAKITRGDLGGADIAMSQLTPTKEREHDLDFTTPYMSSAPGILALRAVDAADVHELRALRWVVSSTSTLTPIVEKRIRPDRPPDVVEDRTAALETLFPGSAEALMLDLPVAAGLAHADPGRFHVIGQLSGGEGLSVALHQGSPNLEIVDSAIRSLQADGTIGHLQTRWLGEGLEDVPLILTED
jgi:polar amino acid transport system substrate-binding protein